MLLHLGPIVFGFVFGVIQVIAIAAGVRHWLEWPWIAALALATVPIALPALGGYFGERLTRVVSRSGRPRVAARLLAPTQSLALQILNLVLVFLGAWYGFGWTWWGALIFCAVLIGLYALVATVFSAKRPR